MITGQRPFLGGSLVALAVKIAKDEPQLIERLRPGVPPALPCVVECCLAKAPDRRFQTCNELSVALTKVLTEMDEAARSKDRPNEVSESALARESGAALAFCLSAAITWQSRVVQAAGLQTCALAGFRKKKLPAAPTSV